MATLPQKRPRVKLPDTFTRNCATAREAGYNLRFTTANVYANGKPVDRDAFETLHPIQMLSLLDSHIGRKGLFFPPEPVEV